MEKSSFLFSVLVVLAGILSASYLTTESFDFGLKVSKLYRQYFPSEDKIFTVKQLARYDGSDPTKPIYIAIMGKVFDVTNGKSHYGKDGSYSFFAGKDASRAYVTGCFKTHLTHDLRGLTEEQVESIRDWVKMYEKNEKYQYVGRLKLPEIDPDSPIPEPCD